MFSEKLLTWYDQARRTLPWRTATKNPYSTWLSEIMLQQTTVATVIPYFNKFLQKWPTVHDLADASLDDVLVEWQGLGYYSRARNLHKCAQSLAKAFPNTEEQLLTLPGIGPYTAAAISSIAFGHPCVAIDGNVIRVMSRYLALATFHPEEEIKRSLNTFMPKKRCGDFTEALMELGALVCTPKTPLCQRCPLEKECKAYPLGKTADFPVKIPKQKLPTRYATAFMIKREDGAILLRKRPPHGLLGGMMEVPTTPWEDTKKKETGPIVKHTFTHFRLEVTVQSLKEKGHFDGIWAHPEHLKHYALPTLMKKIIKVGLAMP